MKSKFLKLNKACSEQWDTMKPNEKGSFCDVCAKNVIDFTELSTLEISEKIKKSKGEICARLTKTQLETPLIDLEIQKNYKLPYSNIAATVLLASTLAIGNTAYAQNEKVPTEFVQNTELSSTSKIKRNQTKSTPTTSDDFITFKGNVKDSQEGKPVKNAKITLVTVQKILTTHSLEDGTFSLEIPVDCIDDANVIRVTYNVEKSEDGKRDIRVYDTKDYVLSKEEISSEYTIEATPIVYILGGIGGHYVEKDPVILQNQKRISYKDFRKAQYGKKSSCNLENKDVMYFERAAAVAIYGKEAEAGLYILVDKPTK
ncbi:hypothetical protein U8527_01930 [Kordia algicida OT-1]|uniref:Uncharacterized protein n=1 Tax=Kordia algicida OT-1 TaxID=391587 RepID=A9DTE4_9FLAO|nr:hypothetical protein [Kordia algicida]EDP97062.1 hypothetical protein KAOT1_17903 [Kordia algicida OT-1]